MVRAGGGSARDTLSVLDQLMGGAGPEGVTYELATGLLGYTPDTLLDEVVDAFAAGDGRTVFGVVDKVIETGQDPRRFTEDLLRRLRDLVIIAAVPDAPATGLIDVPQDQGERLTAQAARFGRADLSRSAELVADGLTELKGATAPRLLLELICARVLLPGADHGTEGLLARLDRIEKRMSIEGTPSAAAPPRPAARPVEPAARRSSQPRGGRAGAGAAPTPSRPGGRACRAQPAGAGRSPSRRPGRSSPSSPGAQPAARPQPGHRYVERPQPGRRTPAVARPARGGQAQAPLHLDPAQPERPGRRRRRQDADDRAGQRRRAQLLQQRRQRGDPAAGRDRRDRPRLAHRVDRRPVRPARAPSRRITVTRPAVAEQPPGAPGDASPRSARHRPAPEAAGPAGQAARRPGVDRVGPGRDPGHPARRRPAAATGSDVSDEDADRDDPDADDHSLGGAQLLERELGASIIEEIKHD